jgi:hypothetical protein
VFHDIDGSVAGVRDSYIVIDNGIADDPQNCQIKPDWNAAVCRAISAASRLAPPVAVEVDLAVEEVPEVVVDLAVLALLEVVAELAVSVEALHRSFSPAMVGNLPSTGTPRYSPVPRSGRKAKRRP